MSLQGMIKNTTTVAIECHPVERYARKNITLCPYLPYSLNLAPRDF